MRIIFLGDSLTEGTMGVSYVDKVAKAMPGHHFINRGVNGDTTLNIYRRIHADVVDEKPDGVFLMIGVNDAISSVEPASNFYFRWFKGIPNGRLAPLASRENMRAILTILLAAQIKVWVALPPVEYSPAQVEALRKVNAALLEVCNELKIPTLDLLKPLVPGSIPERPAYSLGNYASNLLTRLRGSSSEYDHKREAGSFSYTFDGVHLTDSGAQRFADLIVPFLRKNGMA